MTRIARAVAGSEESLIRWEDLGGQGSRSVSSGPSGERITEGTGRPSVEPVRVFVGTAAEDDVVERARLAVDSFEYITGNSAIVSMQYSSLPSWISYLVDQRNARNAARASRYSARAGSLSEARPAAEEQLGRLDGGIARFGESYLAGPDALAEKLARDVGVREDDGQARDRESVAPTSF